MRPHVTRRTRYLGSIAGALGLAVTLGACSSSSSSSVGGGASTTFKTASVQGLGTVVVDGRGRTVYVLSGPNHANLPCTAASGCTGVWPPLPLPNGTTSAKAGSGLQGSLLGTTVLSDGRRYPTYNGWLMYEYSGDSGAGQANGQLIASFGGTWYVLGPTGSPITTATAGSPGGSGY